MKILRLPNWTLFLLIFVAPLFLVSPIRFIINVFFNDVNLNNFFILMMLYFIFRYGWEMAIGLSLSVLLPAEQNFRKPVYVALFGLRIFLVIYVAVAALTIEGFDHVYSFSLLPAIGLWYFLSLYILYQNAKIVRAIELDRRVQLRDVIIYFILLNILPIGIWAIQNSINEFLKQRERQRIY